VPLSDHDHVLDESPRVMYMHIAAHGDAGKIARTIHDALAESKTPLGAPATPAAPSAADVDTMLGGEVHPVIRALRGHGIQVTALHSHMLDESPRPYFMHFWASDDAVTLARG
jgi:hypothetical protein